MMLNVEHNEDFGKVSFQNNNSRVISEAMWVK